MRQLVVLDTNVLVSRLLNPLSVPGRAVRKALEKDRILVSAATLQELRSVIMRPKLMAYIPAGSIEPFQEQIASLAIEINTLSHIRVCRDPKDDKFLEVAVYGKADLIVTGDEDLLALHPFRGIEIVTPAVYLARD